jgi:hypothetical protein
MPVAAVSSVTTISRAIRRNYATAEQHCQTQQDSKMFHGRPQVIDDTCFDAETCLSFTGSLEFVWPFGQALAPIARISEGWRVNFLRVPEMRLDFMCRLHEPMGMAA